MKRRDHYEVLGVPRNASPETIRRAFRTLAVEHHPDRNPGTDAPEEFHQITEAYNVLGDPARRAAYDRESQPPAPAPPGEFFGDLFSFFSRPAASRAADVEVEVDLPLERVLWGGEQPLELTRLAACASCEGSGARAGTRRRRCPACDGAGQIEITTDLQRLRFRRVEACAACKGEGVVNPSPCPRCHGAGRVETPQTLSIPIPPGVEDGMVLQATGQGSDGGDLLITVHTPPDWRFERRGTDLFRIQPVEIVDAVLGATIEIPTLEGSARLKIPPGTQTGTVLRQRGQGLPPYGGGPRGDLLAEVRVHTPSELSPEARALYERLRRL